MDLEKLKSDFSDILGDLLKIGPTHLVGIDIGISSVRVAEIHTPKKGQYKLVRFAFEQLPEGTIIEDDILKPAELVKAIMDAFEKAGITHKNVCIGLSGPNTMSKRLQVSSGKPEEIEDQVLWEAEQYIPFGVDDSTISFHNIGENEGGGIDVFVAAASNELVQKFQELIKEAQRKLKVVDLDVFALSNIFEVSHLEWVNNSETCALIIDFGAQSTSLLIYKNKSVLFTRELSIGGLAITEEIQRQMSLSFEEAEDLKIHGDDNGNLPEEIVEIIDMNLESFFTEIKKTVNFYQTSVAEEVINHCFITGGTSLTPGLKEGLESSLGLQVERINPLDVIGYNEKNITEDMIPYINSCGSIAMGLALRILVR